jgi:hypothetical protein
MDMTGWLEYFTAGLGAQMRDVQMAAEHVMRKDVILARARKNGLKGAARSDSRLSRIAIIIHSLYYIYAVDSVR